MHLHLNEDHPAEFDPDVDPLHTEYTFGPEGQFWAFDYKVSKDGDFMKLAFGTCGKEITCEVIEQVFPMEVALFAAKEAVGIAASTLKVWQEATGNEYCEEKELDWIRDTFLKDIEVCVDAWCATRIKAEGRLN